MRKRLRKKLAKKQSDLLDEAFCSRAWFGEWSDEYFTALDNLMKFNRKYRHNLKRKPLLSDL